MEEIIKDLRYGARALLKDKAVTVVAVLALALGAGANSAIFSVINTVLLKPLPYADADRVVAMWGANRVSGTTHDPISVKNFYDYRAQNRVFDEVASFAYNDFNLSLGDEPERVQGSFVSANFFSALGVRPAIGSNFDNSADQPGAERVVMLGDGLWRRRFASDRNVMGSDVQINGSSFRIVGVMPASFRAPDPLDEVWIPMSFDGADELRIPPILPPGTLQDEYYSRRRSFLQVVARIRQGVSIEAAQADVATVAERLEQDYNRANKGRTVYLISLHRQIVGDIQPALIILLAAVGLVLLIACANVANLLLARAAARTKEIAVRTALGATRARIIRQLLTESILLGLAGGALGLLLALGGIKLLVALNPPNIPRLDEVGIDARVLVFTLVISTLTGIIFGLAPAIQYSKPNLVESLKEGGRGATAGARRQRLRSLIVVAEVALTQVLLIGAGLMLNSFISLQGVDPGFAAENVLTMQLTLQPTQYPEDSDVDSFYDRAIKAVEGLPGVRAAGVVSTLPLAGSEAEHAFTVEGRPQAAEEKLAAITYKVSEDYFPAMGIAVLQGRAFTQQDRGATAPLAIISKQMADRFWPGESPLDRFIRMETLTKEPLRIVGVVSDVRHEKMNGAPPQSAIYVPYFQSSERYMGLAVRTTGDPASAAPAVREAIRSVDRNQPVYLVKPMQSLVSESISQPRLYVVLLSIFAVVALMLAAIGIYGVMSYSVTQRTHEIGVRMALGAGRGDILRMVIRQGMVLALIGTAIGIAAAITLAVLAANFWPGLMNSLLLGVGSIDLTTWITIPALLALVALLAVCIPAIRATRTDPMIALRYE